MDTLRRRFGPLSQNAIQLDMPSFDSKAEEYLILSLVSKRLFQFIIKNNIFSHTVAESWV